jgi:hypothetical protein
VTTRVLLVDLSSTSYPHAGNAVRIDLVEVNVSASVVGTGVWIARIGHVERANTTNGDVQWGVPFYCGTGVTKANLAAEDSFYGTITSSEVTGYISDDEDADQTWLQTDAANLPNALGNTTASAGAGDVVVEFTEASGTATASLHVRARYAAR